VQPENLLYEDSADDARLKLGKLALCTASLISFVLLLFVCSDL